MLVETRRDTTNWILPALDVSASLLTLFVCLPIAGGLPAVASSPGSWADGLWFLMTLGGAFLLLAGGLKLLFRQAPIRFFVVLYTLMISALGILRLHGSGFSSLVGGWFFMALCVGGLLFSLHQPWLWATGGAAWSVLLLGFLSVVSIRSFLKTETERFSFFMPLTAVACLFVLVLLVFHLRYGDGGARSGPRPPEEPAPTTTPPH